MRSSIVRDVGQHRLRLLAVLLLPPSRSCRNSTAGVGREFRRRGAGSTISDITQLIQTANPIITAIINRPRGTVPTVIQQPSPTPTAPTADLTVLTTRLDTISGKLDTINSTLSTRLNAIDASLSAIKTKLGVSGGTNTGDGDPGTKPVPWGHLFLYVVVPDSRPQTSAEGLIKNQMSAFMRTNSGHFQWLVKTTQAPNSDEESKLIAPVGNNIPGYYVYDDRDGGKVLESGKLPDTPGALQQIVKNWSN